MFWAGEGCNHVWQGLSKLLTQGIRKLITSWQWPPPDWGIPGSALPGLSNRKCSCEAPLGPGHTERRLTKAFGWSRRILKELPWLASAGPICRSYEAIYSHTAQKHFYWSWPRTLQNSSSKLQDQGNREMLSSFLLSFPSLFVYVLGYVCVRVCSCMYVHMYTCM